MTDMLFLIKLQNWFKLPSVFKRQTMSAETDLGRYSNLSKTFGHALSWLNKSDEQTNESFEIKNYSAETMRQSTEIEASEANTSKTPAIPLNAYLTYVTLKLQIIIQGNNKYIIFKKARF
jgi:hypothetical protein